MPPVEAVTTTQDVSKDADSISKPMVGIIYPPPEVRNIVDKTASFVARNGPDFESRIRQNEINNPKFNFLTPTDPYHAYYQHKVKEFGEGKGQEPVAPVKATAPQRTAQEVKIPEVIIPKEPPPEPEFIADPPSISAFDLDVVKLTAQFVARNGRTFLTNLMNREQRNYQFDFLRPQHSLFNYFTKLVEQYTKVLIPPKDLMEKLKLESEDHKEIMRQVTYRVQWTKLQEQAKRKEEEVKERERVAYASIDWHDFVVVETVDYQPGEIGHFPLPTSPDEVGARVLMQERQEQEDKEPDTKRDAGDEMELSDKEDAEPQDMDEDSGDEVEMPPPRPPTGTAPSMPGQPVIAKTSAQIVVRKDYDPKQARAPAAPAAGEQWLISPLTNEKIPAHKLQEHMKISLLDPRWREQKERTIREKSEQENVYATGDNIEMNLRGIAERRTDIFGHGGEEAEIGKKIGEEEIRRTDKVVWDGHTASMEKVSQKARENISIEDQIAVIHKAKGLVEDEAKNKIGPASGSRAPVEPLMAQSIKEPAPAVPRPPAPQRQPPTSVPPLVPMPAPQGVPAPAPRPPMMAPMMAPAPGMVLMPGRPQHQLLQPGGMMGVPMGSMAAIPQMRPVYRPVMAPAPVAPVPAPVPAVEDEPPSKRSKTEESLLPEGTWLAQQPGPVTVRVQAPSMPDKPEWNLSGQTLTLTFSPTDMVGSIKAQLSELLGMPAGKQKLQYDGMFIKDSNSLAYYNFMPDSLVQLTTKERGGRKK